MCIFEVLYFFMKKALFLIIVLLVSTFIYSQNVTVDQSTYSVEELINDVLINSPCVSISNVTSSTGTSFGSNGIGYFSEPLGNFPFYNGIILASGDAMQGAGPNNALISTGGSFWPGDNDLTNLAGDFTYNATIVEFDFVPIASEISFRFLMASEEYDMGLYECQYSDVFAFLLTDQNGVTTNLAVLPDTNTPILVTNVHPDNGICGEANPQYFSEYVAPGAAPVAYDGYTRSFTAFSNVVPNQQYHIKLAIADARDDLYDSAVFLEAGSFSLGVNLGTDITIANGNANCVGNNVVLDTKSPGIDHIWYYNGVEISGQTTSTIEVANDGEYSVEVIYSGSCLATDSINVEFVPNAVANPAQNLNTCNGTSVGQFDLTQNDDDVLLAQNPADFIISYFESQADADANINAIANPTNYSNTSNPQQIFTRIESIVNSDCFDTTSFQIDVSGITFNDPISNLELCDDDTDGFMSFPLTDKDGEIIISAGEVPANVNVTYHETQLDADLNSNALSSPYTNVSANNQEIFVRVELISDADCFGTAALNLIVNAYPILTAPTALEVCDDGVADGFTQIDLSIKNPEITGGNPNYAMSYYETQADADSGMNALAIPYTNITNPQTIYARGEDINTGCYATVPLDLVVEQAPVANMPPPMEFCDPDNDGFGVFMLTDSDVIITGGDPTLMVTYHETQANADNNANPLSSPYDNIVAYNQTLYVRVESATIATDCATFLELDLIVYDTPVIADPITPLELCDDNTDGFTQFDLTVKDAEILGAQPPTDFILTYHVTQTDADTGNNAIVNTGSYTNLSNPQTIYVRLEHVVSGCINTGEFELIVNPLPVIVQPTPLELCDDDYYAASDGIQTFDLTVKDTEITSGDGSLLVSYYETQAEAQADSNAITPANAYPNTVNPQTIYVRVTDGDTGCYTFTTLTLRVLPNPTPQTPLPIILCDDVNSGDGVEMFDLTVREMDIINGELGVSATYYETQTDAESGVNVIADPTMHTSTSNQQTIYVRVTNDTTDCYTIVELDLQVNPVPTAIAVTDFIECEQNTDGFFAFDLEGKTPEVLNGQDPAVFAVTYHATQADAQSGINALISPYTNVTNPQQIFVNITDRTTGCDISTQSFNIEVQEAAVANMPLNEYVICDNIGDNDGLGQFDLSTQDAEVLGGQDPTAYTVSYYATQAEAEAGLNPLPAIYENISNPQTIYARVDNTTTICYQTTTLSIRVDLLPVFDIEDSYILCVDSPGGVVTMVSPPVIDTGLDASEYDFQWMDSAGTVVGTDSTYTPASAGMYMVEVTNTATGCQNSDSTEVVQSSPPDVTATVTTLAFADVHVIEASATGEGDYEYSLDGGMWQDSGTFNDVMAGEHEVRTRDRNGCGESSTMVTIMDYPLYFTPNGDGYHDTWNIIGISNQVDAKIYIFDRYGKLLKQLSPTATGWDGTFNGEVLPSSDYWFTVQYREPNDDTRKEFKAHFTLKK